MKLYIIGNGFDLAHGIRSSYSGFKKFTWKEFPEIAELFEEYYLSNVNDAEKLWSCFEETLGELNVDYVAKHTERSIKDYSEEREFHRVIDSLGYDADTIRKNIADAFSAWVEQIDISEATPKVNFVVGNRTFLTFNYTTTLEDVYSIPSKEILHIHGDVKNPIFGHDGKDLKPFSKDNEAWVLTDEVYDSLKPLYDATRKHVKEIILGNKRFFAGLQGVNEVWVYGHSLNNVDVPYFEEVVRNVNGNAMWHISYYDAAEMSQLQERATRFGAKNIKMFQI